MYSQNNEEQIILEYFGNEVGRLLDIGANDGRTLSNSLALIERGWFAVLVEPDPIAFQRLHTFHLDNPRVTACQLAIGESVGQMDFSASGSLLDGSDTSLVSTLVPAERLRFPKVQYESIQVYCETWEEFAFSKETYHFISIDAEGMDLAIVKQMDLKKLRCKMLCIEWNSKDKHLYDEVIIPQGYKLHAVNAENLIYVYAA